MEPFAGSGAFSIACAARSRAKEFWLNDCNKPLAELLGLIINQPETVADFYRTTWRSEAEDALEHYYRAREDFNRTNDPCLLLYFVARCVKASVRYNSEGLFNQSPDKRLLRTRPETMREKIIAVSMPESCKRAIRGGFAAVTPQQSGAATIRKRPSRVGRPQRAQAGSARLALQPLHSSFAKAMEDTSADVFLPSARCALLRFCNFRACARCSP